MADKPELQHLMPYIYGVEVIRGAEAVMMAHPEVRETYAKMRARPADSILCASCNRPMNKIKGMAALMMQPQAKVGEVIAVGLCQKCLHDYPADADLARKVVITCTGYDPGPSIPASRALH